MSFLEGNLSKLQVLQIVKKVIGPCPLDLSSLELNLVGVTPGGGGRKRRSANKARIAKATNSANKTISVGHSTGH